MCGFAGSKRLEGMLDSLYGNLLAGPQPAPQVSEPAKKASGDDMFAGGPEIAKAVSPSVTGPAVAAAPAANAGSAALPTAALPQSFSAAKLMMPPVRKKAEPTAGKKPVVPLDLQKLQEEKAALMRQRAAAAERPASGGADDDGASPASASTAPVGSSAMSTASANGAVSSLYGSPDEEYDPAKPNDYDEFCRRRMRIRAEEEMEKRRQEALARQQQAAKPEVPKEDDFATKMMKKMGWKEGAGLGKEQQGIATPLVLKKTDRATGQIVEGQQKREAPVAQVQPQAKQQKAAEPARPPTRVILLNNLVGAGEVDEDLEEETVEEAGKYGKIKRCAIKEIKGVPDDQAVRIFLEYEQIDGAKKAFADMNGRYFGGRMVRARFFDEARFAKGDLDQSVHD